MRCAAEERLRLVHEATGPPILSATGPPSCSDRFFEQLGLPRRRHAANRAMGPSRPSRRRERVGAEIAEALASKKAWFHSNSASSADNGETRIACSTKWCTTRPAPWSAIGAHPTSPNASAASRLAQQPQAVALGPGSDRSGRFLSRRCRRHRVSLGRLRRAGRPAGDRQSALLRWLGSSTPGPRVPSARPEPCRRRRVSVEFRIVRPDNRSPMDLEPHRAPSATRRARPSARSARISITRKQARRAGESEERPVAAAAGLGVWTTTRCSTSANGPTGCARSSASHPKPRQRSSSSILHPPGRLAALHAPASQHPRRAERALHVPHPPLRQHQRWVTMNGWRTQTDSQLRRIILTARRHRGKRPPRNGR